MGDFYIGSNKPKNPNNPNERKLLAAAASLLKMRNSSNTSKRYDKLVNKIIPKLEKELDDAHDEYLRYIHIKGIVELNIEEATRKVNTIKGVNKRKYDAEKLKKILNKAELNLSEKKKELADLADLEESFKASEKNHAAKVEELEAQLSKARNEAEEILRSVAAFKGGQTRSRKNRVGTKRRVRK